jgi:hypothetical protein
MLNQYILAGNVNIKDFLEDLAVDGKAIIIKEIQDYGFVVDRDQCWALVNTLLDLCWE